MSSDIKFLITYGLHHFVTHKRLDSKHVFTICGEESQKMIGHARSLIEGDYGNTADILVT